MATYAKTILSGSTDGKGILVDKVLADATKTTIHTGSATATTLHEIWLYAVNSSNSVAVKLTVQWGGTASPADDIELTIQPESGLVLVAPGLLIKGNATPLVVRAFAGAANLITIHGYVNTIT
jgi:hypothetical protein